MAFMNQWPIDSATDHEPQWCRSNDGPIAGVAAGIGEQTGIPANLIRVFFVAMAAFGGTGFLLYLGAWMLMLPPRMSSIGAGLAASGAIDRSSLSTTLGGVLIGFGAVLALVTLDSFRGIPFGIVLLSFVGIVLLNRRPMVSPATVGGSTGAGPNPIAPTPQPIPQSPLSQPMPPAPVPPIEHPPTTVAAMAPPPNQSTDDQTAVMETTPMETTPTQTTPAEGGPAETGSTVEQAPAEGTADKTNDPPTKVVDEAAISNEITTPDEAKTTDGANVAEPAEGVPSGDIEVTHTGVGQAQFGAPDPRPTKPDASVRNPVGLGSPDPTTFGYDPYDPTTPGYDPYDPTGFGHGLTGTASFDPDPSNLGSRSHWAVPRAAGETSLLSPPRPPGPPLAAITLTSILAVVGVALVLNTLADVFVGTTTVAGVGLVIVGMAIASTSFRGRTMPLLPIAGVLSVLLVISPVLDHLLSDGAGAQEITVGSVDELQPTYQLGVGSLELDLTNLELTEDTELLVEVGTGAIEIRLPPDLPAEVHAKVNVGYVEVLSNERGGIGPSLDVFSGTESDPNAPTLILLTTLDIGAIDVYR